MINFDFHTHTTYSHGKNTILENAISAKQKNLSAIAITDHGFSHPVFGMRRRNLEQMRVDCTNATNQTGVKVLLGIESNILGVSGKTDVKPKDYDKLDVFLAGVHKFVLFDKPIDFFRYFCANYFTEALKLKPSDRLIKNTTKVYTNAIKNNPIDILTHLNYGCFSNYIDVANCCSDYGTYIEISTKKVHLTDEEWQNIIDKTKVKFVINSDAHSMDRIGDETLALQLFSRINFPLDRIVNINQQLPEMRFATFKGVKL